MKKATKTARNSNIAPSIQLLFVATALLAFIAQLALQLDLVFRQWPNNTNLSGFYWLFLYSAILPVALFALAYILNPRRGFTLPVIFESAVIAIAGEAVFGVLTQVTGWLSMHLSFIQDGFWSWLTWNLVLAGLTIVGFAAALWWLKRTKRW